MLLKHNLDPSPLQSALGIGTSVAGILGALKIMASRVLKRPMFRRGGMANQGIMSGLD